MSVRLAVARDQGLDEQMIARVERGEHVQPRHAAALRLADELMTQPRLLSDEDAAELRAHFSPEEVLELTLDVMKWNHQKVSVSLGLDTEITPGKLADLVFDDEGRFVRP